MAQRLTELIFDELTADPSSPPDGSFWHRSDLGQIRAQLSGGMKIVAPDVPGDMDVALARRSTTLVLPVTYTGLEFDQTDIETNSAVIEHDAVNTERLLLKEAGPYQITYDVDVDLTSTATPEARILVNGTTELLGSFDIGKIGSNNSNVSMTTTISFVAEADDYIEVQVRDLGASAGTLRVNAILQAIRLTGKTGLTGATGPAGSGSAPRVFSADQLLTPNSADWAVNALAPLSADSNNAALSVRRFDDTVEEGIGLLIRPTVGSTNIVIKPVSRAEAGPAGVRTVGLKLYNRGIPDNAAVQAWTAGTALTDIDIPVTNEFFQEDSQSLTLSSLSMTAGELTEIEITRVAPAGGTDLEGDWSLLSLEIEFT